MGAELFDDGMGESQGLEVSRLGPCLSLVGEATGRIAECLGDRDADEDIWELAGRDLAGDWHHVGVHLRSAMDGIDRGHLADAS